MPHADFVHLRVHSAYSLSEGALKTKDLVKLCVQGAMPAVAVTDTGNLFGALEFASEAAPSGVQPIVGCLFGITRTGGRSAGNGLPQPPDRMVLLVQDETGYANLLRLVSRAFMESDGTRAAQLGLADLAGATDGLIALVGAPDSPVGRLLAEGQHDAARQCLDGLRGLFPERLYVELQRHGLAVEEAIEPELLALADATGLPLVATNDAYFADRSMYEAHDALICIAEGVTVSTEERRRLTPEHGFKSAREMRELFADIPEAVDNTLVVARRCAYMPEKRKPILPPFASASGRGEPDELHAQAMAGLDQRLAAMAERPDPAPYRERLGFELDVIVRMGFAGYFLIVADFIQWAKRHGIPVGPGRGSGAGSVVAWALSITDLDPLRHGLLFERFLNPERVSMPDFDIDFCQDRRDEVIRYVQGRYGRDRVAQIITFGKLQARAVLRDVGRVLEMPYGQVDRICKLVPNNPANPVTLRQAIDGEPLLRSMRDEDEQVARLIGIALQLEGLYRHASTHAAGVVIGDRPLDELVPLYRDPRSDMPVTQFNMKYVEAAGLVKFDFLGLKTLTVLAKAEELLRRRGIEVDLANLPLDDGPTFEMLGRADATGVFQLESQGMRDVLRKLRPDRFEDIVAVVALYRPGPMENIPRYIACKHGEEKPDYLHPSIEPILKETFGIMIYQEQVMQIARTLSGYSLGGADLLRRAMGKKIKEEMDAQRQAFVDGAVANGVDKATAAHVFDQVAKFAGYGFNKSHAAAYALVSYQTAYLKANYPVEFFAASMSLDLGNTDKLNTFRQELARLGIPLLPPDVNRSQVEFSVEARPGDGTGERAGAVRYALAGLKGVGIPAMQGLVAARGDRPFAGLEDFAARIDARAVTRKQVEALARAGAFDAFNPNRAQVMAAAETIVREAAAVAADRDSRQETLFGGSGAPKWRLPAVPEWNLFDKLQNEFEAIGFYLSSHPLDAYGKSLDRIGVTRSADLPAKFAMGGSTRVKLAGIVVSKRERTSARGSRFAFVQMSDASGLYEIAVFSEVLSVARDLLDGGQPLLVVADARTEGDTVRLGAVQIEALDKVAASAAAGMRVHLGGQTALESLKRLIEREATGRGGRGRISLVLGVDPAREVEVSLPGFYRVTPQVRAAVKSLVGVVEVQDI
ncbi:DNA polymerase III subunit alpha [Stella sp.]|uniref:DNA polymerase III subunit alpha n=1 Tax=Stella sp. TaxID=2912054 RepID=UPI0035B35C04